MVEEEDPQQVGRASSFPAGDKHVRDSDTWPPYYYYYDYARSRDAPLTRFGKGEEEEKKVKKSTTGKRKKEKIVLVRTFV